VVRQTQFVFSIRDAGRLQRLSDLERDGEGIGGHAPIPYALASGSVRIDGADEVGPEFQRRETNQV